MTCRSLHAAALLGFVVASTPLHAASAELPEGLLFVALREDTWQIHRVDGRGEARPIPTPTEPRTPAYSASTGRIAYVSAAGDVHEIELASGDDTVLVRKTDQQAYTQPTYAPGSDVLYVVTLRQGNSVDSDITRVDRATGKTVPVLLHRSAQFEPTPSRDGHRLYYSHVACAAECGKIIQEIWALQLASGVTEQLTLLNGISRQPVEGEDGTLYFSSNRDGNNHLWRLPRIGAAPERLTDGRVTDDSPAPIGDAVYFVRRERGATRLMRWRQERGVAPVDLPAGISAIRDLRVGQ